MTEHKETYRSIGCSYYDQLEAYAVKRTRCSIVYRSDESDKTAEGIIVDLFAQDSAEFLKLDDGTMIRLDHIVSVNGIPLNYVC
jgi:Rho-binding antiterminator